MHTYACESEMDNCDFVILLILQSMVIYDDIIYHHESYLRTEFDFYCGFITTWMSFLGSKIFSPFSHQPSGGMDLFPPISSIKRI